MKKKTLKQKLLKDKKELIEIIGKCLIKDNTIKNFDSFLEISHLSETSLSFTYTDSYSAPAITFSMLKDLSNTFGTDSIDVDKSISEQGCETCDYGSIYG